MKVSFAALVGVLLLLPQEMRPAIARPVTGGVTRNLGITPVTAEQTLFIGDSITAGWTDEPVRVGYPGFQSCIIRLHLGAALAANPQVKRVVIETGTNDLLQGPGGGYRCNLPGLDPVSSVLNLVREAQAAGLEVFVLSVLPIAWNDRAGHPCNPLVPPFNQTLQAAVTAQGAYWVDDYALFVGQTGLQPDGVHPNEAGYQLMEQAYEAVAAQAEGQ
jgi:lysophospholipase L1-like esterase